MKQSRESRKQIREKLTVVDLYSPSQSTEPISQPLPREKPNDGKEKRRTKRTVCRRIVQFGRDENTPHHNSVWKPLPNLADHHSLQPAAFPTRPPNQHPLVVSKTPLYQKPGREGVPRSKKLLPSFPPITPSNVPHSAGSQTTSPTLVKIPWWKRFSKAVVVDESSASV